MVQQFQGQIEEGVEQGYQHLDLGEREVVDNRCGEEEEYQREEEGTQEELIDIEIAGIDTLFEGIMLLSCKSIDRQMDRQKVDEQVDRQVDECLV